MATWQFSVALIPRSWAIEHNYNAALLYEEEGYETDTAWTDRQPIIGFKDIFSSILPVANSWHKDLLCWGDSEKHDTQVWYKNEKIEDIEIRLDLNQSLNKIVVNVVDAAKALDCVFFFPELKTISEANEFELKNAARKSIAAKFVEDPRGFLDNLDN